MFKLVDFYQNLKDIKELKCLSTDYNQEKNLKLSSILKFKTNWSN